MKIYWVNIYKNNHMGLRWNKKEMAIFAGRSWLMNMLNGGKPLYRIKVKLK